MERCANCKNNENNIKPAQTPIAGPLTGEDDEVPEEGGDGGQDPGP